MWHDRGSSHGLVIADPSQGAASLARIFLLAGRWRSVAGKEYAVHEKQRVAAMADEVLKREAEARAERTGEPVAEALKVVMGTEAGRRLGELRDGPHRDERAARWQEELALERERERARERSRALRQEAERAAWERFMLGERRDLELRKTGQLAKVLGEPLPQEPPEALRRLVSEDRKQAEEGLVALMSNGKLTYKHIDDLSQEDMPARIAANRLRTTWIKERRDGGFVRHESSLGS